jgi:polar amino acid transport system substrate-binding protein
LEGEQEMSEEPLQEPQLDIDSDPSDGKKLNPWLIALIVFGALLVVFLVALIAVNLGPKSVVETPTPPAAVDDSWSKVQAAGVLKAATSADYPPFSFYNGQLDIDGYDPALIRAIGAVLGVQVEVSDYAFEGLGATLQVGQADVAIAALSVTAEREAIADFSNIYYVGSEGILARVGSGIGQISNPRQLAGKRVGVQRQSIYQEWAQTALVETGIIAQDKLYAYAKPEHAISDLKLDRLDVVILDLQPATLALGEGDLALVGQGLSQQRYAIAMSQGSIALRSEINTALVRLQNDGTLNQLAEKFLGLKPEDVIPPPTPEPTPQPCIEAMQFIEDLNYDDNNLTFFPDVDGGESFNKGWRIKNTGTCPWNSAYFLKYVRGSDPAAQMQGQPTAIQGEVHPGQTYDMYVKLVAPEIPGQYIAWWQLFNSASQPFGQTVYVAVEVVSDATVVPTNTPADTSTPTFEATETPITLPTDTAVPQPTSTPEPIEPTPTEKPGAELLDTTWVVTGYRMDIEQDELQEPSEDTSMELVFEENDQYNGNSGCNTYMGRYVTDGVNIILNAVGLTQLNCEQPAGIMEQEALYLQLLEQVEEYRITENDKLEMLRYIQDANGNLVEKVLLEFEVLRAVPL